MLTLRLQQEVATDLVGEVKKILAWVKKIPLSPAVVLPELLVVFFALLGEERWEKD